MDDDDGTVCTRLILFTRAWSRKYAPPSLGDHMTVAVFERQDQVETEPVFVPSLELLAELLEQLTPPLVTIRSAPGEDVEALMGLVERTTTSARLH